MYTIFVLLLIIFVLLFFEKYLIASSISKIPVRILVNGTRGKSTVVKNISSLLRSNNIKTFSKITGATPTYFLDDTLPTEIRRNGGARITEQFKMIRNAAKNNSDAIVLECMSINPELQKIESKVLQPQYYIITNIREDHLEEMGSNSEEWIDAICSAIPDNCTVVTAEKKYFKEIQEYAVKKNCKVISISSDMVNTDINSFGFQSENFKISSAILKDMNLIDYKSIDEIVTPGYEKIVNELILNEFRVKFVNGFAINDVPSAQMLIDELKQKSLFHSDVIIIFNSRADRPIRSVKFVEWMVKLEHVTKYIMAGDNSNLVIRTMYKNGMNKNSIIKWNYKQALSAKESLKDIIKNDTCIIGLGNIKETGFAIINSLNES